MKQSPLYYLSGKIILYSTLYQKKELLDIWWESAGKLLGISISLNGPKLPDIENMV